MHVESTEDKARVIQMAKDAWDNWRDDSNADVILIDKYGDKDWLDSAEFRKRIWDITKLNGRKETEVLENELRQAIRDNYKGDL